jgi:hypothetical protein
LRLGVSRAGASKRNGQGYQAGALRVHAVLAFPQGRAAPLGAAASVDPIPKITPIIGRKLRRN